MNHILAIHYISHSEYKMIIYVWNIYEDYNTEIQLGFSLWLKDSPPWTPSCPPSGCRLHQTYWKQSWNQRVALEGQKEEHDRVSVCTWDKGDLKYTSRTGWSKTSRQDRTENDQWEVLIVKTQIKIVFHIYCNLWCTVENWRCSHSCIWKRFYHRIWCNIILFLIS